MPAKHQTITGAPYRILAVVAMSMPPLRRPLVNNVCIPYAQSKLLHYTALVLVLVRVVFGADRVRLGEGRTIYTKGRDVLLRWRMHDGSSWARIVLGRRPKWWSDSQVPIDVDFAQCKTAPNVRPSFDVFSRVAATNAVHVFLTLYQTAPDSTGVYYFRFVVLVSLMLIGLSFGSVQQYVILDIQ